jgi:nucleoside 2-deoxyribosyltransferase
MSEHVAASDRLVAYLPTTSMGTALEMYVAHARGVPVVTISPLAENWVARALSRRVYLDLDGFMRAVESSGSLADLR